MLKDGHPLRFGASVLLTILLVHAFDFFLHEYAHACMAWLMGWKDNAFALNYGSLRIDNILMQQQIDENVDYAPIFTSGHSWQAACIAAAGPLLANGGTALACDVWLARLNRTGSSANGLIWWLVWIDAFATFNVWSYAPLRVLTSHGDMALLAQGLGISTYGLFPIVTLYAGWLVYRFALRALPDAQRHLYPVDQRLTFSTTVLATSFGFFSVVGLGGAYGAWSALLCMASLFLFLPTLLSMQRTPEV